MPNATWQFLINWDRDSDYTDAYDDVTPYVKDATFSYGFKQPFLSVADEMTATLRLDNADRRFSPENTSGTAYGKVLPMRPVRIQSVYSGGTITQWQGWVESIQPDWNTHSSRETVITATGPKFILEKSRAYMPIMQDVTTDEVIAELLKQVTFPPPYFYAWHLGVTTNSQGVLGTGTYLRANGLPTSLETGRARFSYVGDTWQEGIDVSRAIASVVQAERGKFFITRGGTAVFWNRHHTLLDTNNDGTVSNTMHGMNYVYGADIANVVRTKIKPRSVSAGDSEILWELDKTITIPGLSSKTIRARFGEQDSDSKVSALTVRVPVKNTTFVSNPACRITSFTYTSQNAELEIYNPNHRESEVTVLQLLGKKVTTRNDVTVEDRDGNSIYLYTKRELDLDLGILESEEEALSIVKYELTRRKDAAGEVRSITLLNQTTATLSEQVNRTVGDRVRIVETQTGHDSAYFIVGVEHRISTGQKLHETTWYLEKADKVRYWILGRSGFSALGTQTRVAPL